MDITQLKFKWSGWQMSIKLIAIFFLSLIMLIPKFMLMDLVQERASLNDQVNDEVAQSWAKDQLISGPYLTIPYLKKVFSEDKKEKLEKNFLVLVPDNLNINGKIDTDRRSRSLYNVLLYKSSLTISGHFVKPKFEELNIDPQVVKWNESFISLSIADPKGIAEEVKAKINNTDMKFAPGTNELTIRCSTIFNNTALEKSKHRIFNTNNNTTSGLHSFVYPFLKDPANFSFEIPIELKGSRGLLFSPTAKNCTVDIHSSFNSPSFIGEYLPEHNLSDSGFVAQWKITEYNKTIPNQFHGLSIPLDNSIFGVIIQNPVNHYSQTERACKYIILFIIVIFLALFITEVYNKSKVHIFQYVLMGLAIIIFFALLLSISEFLGFNYAYLTAFSAIIIMIYLYSTTVFKDKRSSYVLSGLVCTFFSFIFIIIQLEKTALLFGTIMLFILLAATMYLTRKITWGEEDESEKE